MDDRNERATGQGLADDRILPWSQVKIISGLSRTTVWRLQRSGDFPAAVQVSPNRVGWWQSDLLEWKRSRTPRRLPEPRKVPAEAERPRERRVRKVEAREVNAPPAPPPSVAPPAARRRRKRPECERQTAFDF